MAMDILKALMLQKFPVGSQEASNRRLSIALNSTWGNFTHLCSHQVIIHISEEDMKVMCQLLPRLHIPLDLDQEQALHLKMLTNALSTVSFQAYQRGRNLMATSSIDRLKIPSPGTL